jgi:uncharacterized protein (TIGR03435 family)
MGSRPFDINAKVDAETAARWIKMTQPEVDEGRRSMTRSRLADRFHLKFHHETREMPTLVLRVAKSGAKLQTRTRSTSCRRAFHRTESISSVMAIWKGTPH